MAKAKLTADLGGMGGVSRIEVEGNLATEDAIEELIKAVQVQANSQKIKTEDLQDNLDDASGGLDEFSDELDMAVRSQDKLNKQVIELTKNTARSTASFVRTTGRTESMADMVESAGEVVSGLAGGLAGLVPFIGEGTARLAEAATQAGFMLLSMAVGAIEGFQALNRSIMDSGTLLDGGFTGFARAADEAGLPIQLFGEAILANTNRLRLMSGGAPGGLARLASGIRELNEASSENMAELYALGFSASEVTAGMANVAIAADRAGQNLSSEELAAGTYDYLRNLRELSRLTGISAEEAMAQVEANRANLFIQNQLMGLAPEQRNAAQTFIAAMEGAGLGPLTDFAMTGQYLNQETALMATRMGPLADIMRQYFLDLESGVDPESAMARFNEQVAINEDAIRTAILENARTFGLTRELAEQFASLGVAGLSIERLLEAVEQGTDPLAGAGDTGENLSITMGELQQAVLDSQTAIQSTFVEGLSQLSGDEGLLTSFARSISGAAIGVDNFGAALNDIMRGDFAAAAEHMGVNSNRASFAPTAAQNVRNNPHSDPEVQALLEQVVANINQIEQQQQMNVVSGMAEDFNLAYPVQQLNESLQELQTLIGVDQAAELMRSYNIQTPQYDQGGISRFPDSGGLAELHGTEAVVPLPDGRTIPVSLSAGGMSSLIVDALAEGTAAADNNTSTIQSFAASLDNSRSLPELVNISRNMLGQMTASTQKLEQMIRAMEQGNVINRNAAYARA